MALVVNKLLELQIENFERTCRKKFPKQDGFQSSVQSLGFHLFFFFCKVKAYAREAGFNRILFWYAPVALSISSGEESVQFLSGEGIPALAMLKTEEQKTVFFNNMKECVDAHLSSGNPLLFDVGYLICFKDQVKL